MTSTSPFAGVWNSEQLALYENRRARERRRCGGCSERMSPWPARMAPRTPSSPARSGCTWKPCAAGVSGSPPKDSQLWRTVLGRGARAATVPKCIWRLWPRHAPPSTASGPIAPSLITWPAPASRPPRSDGYLPAWTSNRILRGWLTRPEDPGFYAKAAEVCNFYLHRPPGSVVLSVDEKTAMQARSRRHPTRRAHPGQLERREFEYRRHGTAFIVAALDVHTGQVLVEDITRNDSVTFITFLRLLEQAVQSHRLYLAA